MAFFLGFDFSTQQVKFTRDAACSKLATDLCLSWPKVLNLVTVRGLMKTLV